jgi:predicted DNA binding CopG/RHH family protein
MSNNENLDNIEAAMDKLAETLEPTRKPNTGSTPGDPAMKQVIIRATESDQERWKTAAEKQGLSLAEFVRRVCNDASARELDCPHPVHMRKVYPWSERCTACNKRLR